MQISEVFLCDRKRVKPLPVRPALTDRGDEIGQVAATFQVIGGRGDVIFVPIVGRIHERDLHLHALTAVKPEAVDAQRSEGDLSNRV